MPMTIWSSGAPVAAWNSFHRRSQSGHCIDTQGRQTRGDGGNQKQSIHGGVAGKQLGREYRPGYGARPSNTKTPTHSGRAELDGIQTGGEGVDSRLTADNTGAGD